MKNPVCLISYVGEIGYTGLPTKCTVIGRKPTRAQKEEKKKKKKKKKEFPANDSYF